MKRTRTAIPLAALAALLLALTAGSAGATGQVGETAAGFTLPSAGGATPGPSYSLSDYDGKVKFLFMFGYG